MNKYSAFRTPHSAFRTPHSAFKRLVVMTASAGGIEALKQVLSRLPADLPAAVLIVQHLRYSKNRETRLPEHLNRFSPLQVWLVEDGMLLETGRVYLAVPGQHLYIKQERLKLRSDPLVHYVRPAADVLFSSAAQAYGSRVIGVVLSGTGVDGASGCQAIKAQNGITIAQDENTAAPYFAMPRAAIEAGAIDYVLPLEEIAAKIIELVTSEE
jgi:two-component system chemotaxis response regulator CheB